MGIHLNSLTWKVLWVCLWVLSAGCSPGPKADYGKLGLLEVAGTISLDGQPVPKAAIFFYHADSTYSYGITDESGHYVAMLNSEKSGVLPGEKRIEISTVKSPIPGALSGDEGLATGEAIEEDPDRTDKKKKGKGEAIPACYNSKSTLKVTITSSDRKLDFELKSDCSTSGPTK